MTSAFGETVLLTTDLAVALGIPKIDWGTGRWRATEAQRIVQPTAPHPLLRIWLFEGVCLVQQYKHDGIRGISTHLPACHVLQAFINRPTDSALTLLRTWAGVFLHDLHRDAEALEVVKMELPFDIEDMYDVFDVIDPDELDTSVDISFDPDEDLEYVEYDDEEDDWDEEDDEDEEPPARGFRITETVGIGVIDPVHQQQLADDGFVFDSPRGDEEEDPSEVRHRLEREDAITRIEARNAQSREPRKRVTLFGPDGKELS